MNVVVTVFYAIAIAWFVGLGIFALVKYLLARKKRKQSDKKSNSDE